MSGNIYCCFKAVETRVCCLFCVLAQQIHFFYRVLIVFFSEGEKADYDKNKRRLVRIAAMVIAVIFIRMECISFAP